MGYKELSADTIMNDITSAFSSASDHSVFEGISSDKRYRYWGQRYDGNIGTALVIENTHIWWWSKYGGTPSMFTIIQR